jgi:hypothetical protein
MSNIQPRTRVRTWRSHAALSTTPAPSASVSHSSIHIQLPHPITLQINFRSATLNSKEENLCKLWLQQVPKPEFHHPTHISYETRAFLLFLGLDPRPLSNEQIHQIILGIHVHHKALCTLNSNTANAEALPTLKNPSNALSQATNPSRPIAAAIPLMKITSHNLHNSENLSSPSVRPPPPSEIPLHPSSTIRNSSQPSFQGRPPTEINFRNSSYPIHVSGPSERGQSHPHHFSHTSQPISRGLSNVEGSLLPREISHALPNIANTSSCPDAYKFVAESFNLAPFHSKLYATTLPYPPSAGTNPNHPHHILHTSQPNAEGLLLPRGFSQAPPKGRKYDSQ